MPTMRKDRHSGAIIFDLTPDEQSVKDLRVELEGMRDELAQQLVEVKKLTSKAKKTTSK